MKTTLKRLLWLWPLVFVFYFSLVASLYMDETHGFFYLTPTKITIRLLVSTLLAFQISSAIDRAKSVKKN